MSIFTLRQINKDETVQPIYKLERDRICLLDEFIALAKSDPDLEPLLGDLFATVRYVADGKQPPLPKKRIKKVKGQKNAWEARKGILRMYLMIESSTGVVIIIGGTKGSQDEDLERLKTIIKEFLNTVIK